MSKYELRNIPGVDKLLNDDRIKEQLGKYSRDFVVYCLRNELAAIRERHKAGKPVLKFEEIVDNTISRINNFLQPTYKKVINATGIVLHTNLGRAPFGEEIMKEISPLISAYSNLEFNLDSGKRGKRTDHIIDLIKFATRAEDAVVVNNNAAAVSLALRTFADAKEVIISRGELIEIGGSFRLPEIMSASGSIMREIGTTNRTRLTDYESAINKNTSVILKANRSNYSIEGFTEETGIKELTGLCKKHGLILIYDIGSGLLKNFDFLPEFEEPSVRENLEQGADLITFSCDKLLGGPQAGIIAGRKDLISVLAKSPLMRTYRVDKFTIAALSYVLRCYLQESELPKKLSAFKFMKRDKKELRLLAENIADQLKDSNYNSVVEESSATCGGGTVPHLKLDSYAVKITPVQSNKNYAKDLYLKMLAGDTPVAGIVREGKYYLDVFTIEKEDIPHIVNTLFYIS
jgi:L-seryl-tRNA(Ser) seleniumtransferase